MIICLLYEHALIQMLEVEERITFSWSNLTVEIEETENKNRHFNFTHKKERKPPKKILENGKNLIKYYLQSTYMMFS